MTWEEVIEDETLDNLPFKIELDEWGNIVMRPASNRYRMVQATMMLSLSQRKENSERGGLVSINCSVATSKGVKVADVVWLSSAFITQNRIQTPYKIAPELCVEIVSPSNSDAEMTHKRDLYFAKGAKEVWLCDEGGHVSFFNHYGQVDASDLFPDFSGKVDLPSA